MRAFLLDKMGIRKMVNGISTEIIHSLLHREYTAVLTYLKVLAVKRNKCINTYFTDLHNVNCDNGGKAFSTGLECAKW